MKSFASFLLYTVGVVISIFVSVQVMINGWGLQPKSWWWIIGMSLIGYIIGQVFVEVAKRIAKDE
jgi:RsiW-degrading membrane proteinase PrsW (M82 family)